MSDYSSNQENEPPAPARPTAVSVIAIIGFIGSLIWAPLPPAWHLGFGYAFHMLLSSTLGMVCMYGFWRMWRWSVFVYAGLAALDTLYYCVLLRHRVYGPPALELVIALLGFMYLRRMR
jgi:hypothetical protein